MRTTSRALFAVAFCAGMVFMVAATAEAACRKCSAGHCADAPAWESGNCDCRVKCRLYGPDTEVCTCGPIGICDQNFGCLSGGDGGPPPMFAAESKKASRCQSAVSERIAFAADPAVFDLLNEQFFPLGALVEYLDLVEGVFQGNMGSRPAWDPGAETVPGPEFLASLSRTKEGNVRLLVSFQPADESSKDQATHYEVLLSKDLMSGELTEKKGGLETRFGWNAEDVARERAILRH